MSGLRVLAFGAWDRGAGYPRGDAILEGLRRAGASVVECRIELPYSGVAKRRLIAAPWRWPGYLLAMSRARRRVQAKLRAAVAEQQPDLVLVPYPGHFVVRWVRSVFRGTLVLDLFLSAYDTVVLDRQLCGTGSLLARYLRSVDRRACAAADRVLVDTKENARFLAELTGVPFSRFAAVPVCDPGEPAVAVPFRPPAPGEPLRVLFFGTGVPLHGLRYLLDAVALIDDVRLTLIGGAPEDRARAREMSEVVEVLDEFVGDAELREQLAATHVVAGVFGTSPKTARVVPFKVVHALAAGRPVVTGATPAVLSALESGVDCITAPCGDASALAGVLQAIASDPGRLTPIAAAARRKYEARFSLAATGRELCAALGHAGSESCPEGVTREVTLSST